MKPIIFSLLALLFSLQASVAAALQVFACEPEWAALTRILAPQAQIVVATHAGQDPHHIEARPSLLAAMRRVDVAVCTGASLESGWLPMLQSRSGNPRIQDGQPGMIYMSRYTTLIDQRPFTLSPFAGDVHPEGNPHFHLDPERLPALIKGLSEALGKVDPAQANAYQQRANAFSNRWQTALERWRGQSAGLERVRLVVQHTDFAYLFRWLGVQVVADLEPKPGVPPTPGHLSSLLSTLKAAPPSAIWTAAYQDARPARWLAGQLGNVPIVNEPATLTEQAGEAELLAYFARLIERVREVARPR